MKNRNLMNNGRAGLGRREFLKLAGGAGTVFFAAHPYLSGSHFSALAQTSNLSKFTEQLPIPPKIDLTGGGSATVEMKPATHNFHASLPATPTFGYGGASYLGPTIEARRGVPITLSTYNNLAGPHPLGFAIDTTLHGALESDRTSPRAAVHLHGGNTSPENDGRPTETFLPGTGRSYYYTNGQQAGTIWYHDHALGITRLNVYAGLAGFYWIRDEFDTGRTGNPLGLPTDPYEIPLVIQDKMFNSDGTLAYPPGPDGRAWAPEFFGDVAVVNGKAFPNLNVDRGLYRFRIVNGSNARFYDLKLSNGGTIYQIGTDSGFLNAPVPLTRLLLAPGERADVLIDFSRYSAGSTIVLGSNAPVPFPSGSRSRRFGVPLKQIMQFTVKSSLGFQGTIPNVLRQSLIVSLNPVRTRNLSLVELTDMEEDVPLEARLNNLEFETTQIETPTVNTVEQWNIINTTGDTHPIHLHLVQFLVMNRQRFDAEAYTNAVYPCLEESGVCPDGPWPVPSADDYTYGPAIPPAPNEAGWKDTVRANPGEITRILVPFGANAALGVPFDNSFTGDYVWHCHILEHEDNEMMLPYRVVP